MKTSSSIMLSKIPNSKNSSLWLNKQFQKSTSSLKKQSPHFLTDRNYVNEVPEENKIELKEADFDLGQAWMFSRELGARLEFLKLANKEGSTQTKFEKKLRIPTLNMPLLDIISIRERRQMESNKKQNFIDNTALKGIVNRMKQVSTAYLVDQPIKTVTQSNEILLYELLIRHLKRGGFIPNPDNVTSEERKTIALMARDILGQFKVYRRLVNTQNFKFDISKFLVYYRSCMTKTSEKEPAGLDLQEYKLIKDKLNLQNPEKEELLLEKYKDTVILIDRKERLINDMRKESVDIFNALKIKNRQMQEVLDRYETQTSQISRVADQSTEFGKHREAIEINKKMALNELTQNHLEVSGKLKSKIQLEEAKLKQLSTEISSLSKELHNLKINKILYREKLKELFIELLIEPEKLLLSGRKIEDIVKKMLSVKIKVSKSYFPEFLEEKSIDFILKKIGFQDRLDVLRHNLANKDKYKGISSPTKVYLRKIDSCHDVTKINKKKYKKRDSEEKSEEFTKFWVKDVDFQTVNAQEIKSYAKSMIRDQLYSGLVKAKKPVLVRLKGVFKSVIEWQDCDLKGKLINPNYIPPINTSRKDSISSSESDGIKENEAIPATVENSKKEFMDILRQIQKLQEQEISRIIKSFLSKNLQLTNILNLYKLFLVLFGNKDANMAILEYLRVVNNRNNTMIESEIDMQNYQKKLANMKIIVEGRRQIKEYAKQLRLHEVI